MAKYNLVTTLGVDASGMKAGMDGAVKNIGELKRELVALRNTSFAGKSAQEIAALNLKIGQLTDDMGDLRATQKVLGTELSAVALKGVQAFGAMIEVGFGVATMFGASEEQAKKYQQTMTNLIGVMQGLAVIEDLVASGELKAIAIRLRAAVVTAALAVKTAVVTAAQWLWNVALAANPIGAVIMGVTLLIAGIISLVKWMKSNTDEVNKNTKAEEQRIAILKKSKEAQEDLVNTITTKALDSTVAQKVEIEALVGVINKSTRSTEDKEKALKKLIALDPSYLDGLNMSNIATADGSKIIDDYIKNLDRKARAEAAMSAKSDIYKKQLQGNIDIAKAQAKIMGIYDEKDAFDDKTKGVETPEWNKKRKEFAERIAAAETELRLANIAAIGDAKALSYLTGVIESFIDVEATSTKAITGTNKAIEDKNKLLTEAKSLVKWWNENPLGKTAPKNGETRTFGKDAGATDFTATMQGKTNIPQISVDYQKTQLEALKVFGQEYADITKENWEKIDKADVSGIRKAQKAYSDFMDELNRLVQQGMADMVAGFAEGIANLLTQEKGTKSFGSTVLSVFGNFLSAMGKAIITFGVTMTAFQAALKNIFNPIGAIGTIAAGAALVIAGTVITNLAAKGMANGGIVGGSLYAGDKVPIMANSGEMMLNQSQQAELFKMANGGQAWGAGEVEFKIRGTDLVGVISNYNRVTQKTR